MWENPAVLPVRGDSHGNFYYVLPLSFIFAFWSWPVPCWLPECSKAGPASTTLKKTEIIIWFRHWERWEEWQQSWVPGVPEHQTLASSQSLLLFSSQNMSGINTKPSHYENVIHNILASISQQLLSKILYKKEAFVVFIMHVRPGEKPNKKMYIICITWIKEFTALLGLECLKFEWAGWRAILLHYCSVIHIMKSYR